MDTVTSTLAAGTSQPTQTAASTSDADGGAITADFDTFLQLLTTQLRNQDPLNPVDSTDFVAQLANFSAVEQQTLTNQLLEELIAQSGPGGGLGGAADWIGLEVAAPGAAQKTGNSPVIFEFSPKASAQSAIIAIRDASGVTVATSSAEPLSGQYEWTGLTNDGSQVPDGEYTAEIAFFADDTLQETIVASAFSEVTEVRVENGTPVLILANGTQTDPEGLTAVRAPAG